MKDGTEQKLKFMKLRARLGLRTYATRGLLDSLWAFARNNCPAGDVGRFTDEEIALGVDWDGAPDALISALIDTKWLDTCAQHRLIVHDWSEHCEDSVHRTLARQRQFFADGTMPSLSKVNSDERGAIAADFQASGGPKRGDAKGRAARTVAAPRSGRPARRSPARPGPAMPEPSLAIARPGPASATPEPEPAPGPEPRQGDAADSQHEPPAESTPDRTGACAAGVAGGAPAPEPEPDAAPPPRGTRRTEPDEPAARDGATGPPKSHGRLLARIDAARLRDTAWLMAWVADASGVDPPLVSDCDADRLRVLGVAERALEAGDDPPKLFVSLVRRRDWEHVTQAQEDRAARRYREYQDARRGDGARRAALASQLAAIGKPNGTEAHHAKAISGAR